MATINRFEDLEIWRIAREINKEVWCLIKSSPIHDDYKLKDQMNGASGSIMDNIAEGFERDGRREFIQFLNTSKASCGELRSQLYRCLDRKYIGKADFELLYGKIILTSKKIRTFMDYLKSSDKTGTKFKKT